MPDHQCFRLDDTTAAQGILAWLSMWSQFIGRTTGALEWTAEGNNFHGNMEYMELSHLKIFWASSSPFAVRRVASSPSVTFRRGFKVMLQVQGNTTVIQNGVAVDLVPGDWTAYDAGSPYEVINRSDFEQITLLVPRDSLSSRRDVRLAPLFRPHSSTTGIGKVFWGFLKSIVQEDAQINAQCERSIASAVECMLMQLLSNASTQSDTLVIVDVRDSIRNYIKDNLHDPELSLETVARALNTTKRSLHRAFEAETESISDYIWRLRLERCQQILDQTNEDRSLTDLAFAHGFKDLAHFSRRFKQFAGLSPRNYLDRGKYQPASADMESVTTTFN